MDDYDKKKVMLIYTLFWIWKALYNTAFNSI
jgi:hypothetical protein